jgi:8-oxo-dGTP pyrophosphatase MutT (NUDIX family)
MDENDVTIEDTAVRELVEETGVRAQKNDLQKKLTALFYIEKDGEINPFMEVVFFTILSFEGVPVESAEMGKPEWFTKDELPYDLMMPADRILFKKIFSNAYKEYVVVLKGKGVAPVVEEVCNCTFIE